MTANDVPLLELDALKVHFRGGHGVFRSGAESWVRAVDGVSLTVDQRETHALVGESGCGKTTTGRAVVRIIDATAGTIRFQGRDITVLRRRDLKPTRRQMQMIFQDPYASLNPRLTVGDIIGEPLAAHHLARGRDKRDRVGQLLNLVGLNPRVGSRYPHEFSGGQRQRIGIARALAVNPSFIVCDEPISALDVSIRAQIINLLMDLQERFGIAYLFIAHDLAVVRHMAHRVSVMYLGKIVETGPTPDLFKHPLHPYTQALLSAIPVPSPQVEATRRRIVLTGDVPSAASPPPGCRFNTRCPYAQPICTEQEPALIPAQDDHAVACHFWAEIASGALRPNTVAVRHVPALH